MPVVLCLIRTFDDMRCSLRSVKRFIVALHTDAHGRRYQNLQQSRGFGNNFRFPEGQANSGGASAPAGNTGFADDSQDDDLYA